MTYSNLLFASVILPVSALALYFDRSAEYKNLILCVTSILFLLWGRPLAAGLLLLTFIVDFALALAIGKVGAGTKAGAALLALDGMWNTFVFLVGMKPWIFPASSPLHLRGAMLLPGMAFYTLKNFSYVYDVYTARVKPERNPFCLLTYSIAYPFMLAGPVVRYGDIKPQLLSRALTPQLVSEGLCSFAAGLAKTVILLPPLTRLTEITLRTDKLHQGGAWLGMAAFFAACYVGFTGLSDMGTGIARINGFDVKTNYLPISSEKAFGGLVKSCNTSMIEFAQDVRDDLRSKNAALGYIVTVAAGAAAAVFYGGGRYWAVAGAAIGIWLAIEFAVGYKRIEAAPRVVRFLLALAGTLLLLTAFAFDTSAERHAWLNAALGRGVPKGLGSGVGKFVRNNVFLLTATVIYITPLKRLITEAAKKLSERSVKDYVAVQRVRRIFLALLMAVSYLLMAAELL